MITITEALAELKTIDKRVEKKQQFIMTYVVRQDLDKDPLECDGGSFTVIAREIQAIGDLRERVVQIRRAIALANAAETITISGTTRTIADWLTWRREAAPKIQAFLQGIGTKVSAVRKDAQSKGLNVVASNMTPSAPQDVIVYVNEADLASQIEKLEEVLGTLDGQLSLKNATVTLPV